MKYPMQIAAIVRKDKTFGIDSNLCLPLEEEYNSDKKMPLEMHSNYSRFTFTILDKEKNVRANVPAKDVEFIYEQTLLSQKYIMDYKVSHKDEAPQSIAYTQKLFDKNYKGKTPAEVLLADPSQESGLLKARAFLEQNAEKYKANKKQMQAIDEAIKMLKDGTLSGDGNVATTNIDIYNEPIKIPNSRKVDDKGRTFVYAFSIICMPDKDYPFAVNIMNTMAPVNKAGTGQVTAQMDKATDTLKMSILLSQKEWLNIITQMHKTLTNFESMNFQKQYRLAEKNSYHHNTNN